jgi:transposase
MATVFEVRDELWEIAEPLIPPVPVPERQGRRPVSDRVCFNAIIFVQSRASPGRTFRASWGVRARRRGGGCATGRRRARGNVCIPPCSTDSTRRARSTGRPRWWTAATSALIKGALTGPSPVDRGRMGSKHHLLVDAAGIPLAISLTGGDRNDVTELLPLVDGVGPVRGKVGRPRLRADNLIADRGYDHDKYRRELWARGKPIIARRATEHGSGLGTLRWVVERTFAWLHQFRRLRVRWERRPELHEAFMHLACPHLPALPAGCLAGPACRPPERGECRFPVRRRSIPRSRAALQRAPRSPGHPRARTQTRSESRMALRGRGRGAAGGRPQGDTQGRSRRGASPPRRCGDARPARDSTTPQTS